jgi:hypothetical protein
MRRRTLQPPTLRVTLLIFVRWQVLEENAIVAEVTFGEASSGAAIVQGSYVGANSSQPSLPLYQES